ncbi:hypothetical protein OAG56_06535 [Mariniblastus sp.]|nr:hypothetical protein [Mariniblastus sp.]MDB4671191.1 hypothetical protein [Pirellulaceae bacterium]MDB4757015.1 hypothetical protein [Mariniblastus sp.]
MSSKQTRSQLFCWSVVPWIIIFFCCLNSRAGIDHGQYLKWTTAFHVGDFEPLCNEKNLTSVTGLPFSSWSAGPGLLIFPAYAVLSVFGLQQGAGLITGFFCSAIFWVCFYESLRLLSDPRLATIGCLLAAIGTPIGFYCSDISSETWTLAPAGYLFLQASRLVVGRSINIWPMAASTAILMMLRSYLAVYAWPVLLVGFFSGSGFRGNHSKLCCPRIGFFTIVFFSIGCAILQIGVVNYWMTGDLTRSPYRFGDALFQSFHWSSPFWLHVLLDPFHGLLPSHPLVGFGILILPVLILLQLKRGRTQEAVIWSIFLVAVLVNLYVQGCWFYWWLAIPSFGMRGLLLVGLPAIGGMVRLYDQVVQVPSWQKVESDQFFRYRIRLIAVTVGLFIGLSTLWGWLHWWEAPTNCVTMVSLGGRLLDSGGSWVSWSGTAALLFGLVAGALFFYPLKQSSHVYQVGIAALLIALFCAFQIRCQIEYSFHLSWFLFCVAVFTILVVLINFFRMGLEQIIPRFFQVTFLVMVAVFASLILKTGFPPVAGETWTMVFNRPDARRAYLTLLQIPRLRGQAEDLRQFFERTQDPEWVSREIPANRKAMSPQPESLTVSID